MRPNPLAVHQIRKNVFHGFGLYPTRKSVEPTFLVPSVFAQSRWIVRRLTLMERLLAYDLPEHFANLFVLEFAVGV